MGGATLAQVKSEFEERIESGEFVEVQRQGNSPDRAFTTAEMIDYERDTINTCARAKTACGASDFWHALGYAGSAWPFERHATPGCGTNLVESRSK